MIFAISVLSALMAIGTPIVFVLGIAATLTLLYATNLPLELIAHRFFAGLDNFPVMAIPFFVLAGVIMDVGGLSRRIVDFATALVGWITGSVLMIAVVAATALAAMSGSGGADAAAVQSVMTPELRRRRYDLDFAAAMIATAGTLAAIIPPSIFMVLICITNNLSIGALFISGVIPGLITSVGLMLVVYVHARRGGPQYRSTDPFRLDRLGQTFWNAIPALFMIVIIMGGILAGLFTPTEAAAVAAAYGLLVGVFVYRDLRVQDLPMVFNRAIAFSAGILLLIATASIFNFLIAVLHLPATITTWLNATVHEPWTFLLIVNILLLIIGAFSESNSMILILSPVLMPIALSYGIDPIHFALVVVYNLTIGTITPPFGGTVFVTATIAERPIGAVSAKLLWPWSVQVVVLFFVTYIPEIGLWLPRITGYL